MQLTKQGIRQLLGVELTNFFLKVEQLMDANDKKDQKIKALNKQIEQLNVYLEARNNELIIIRDRARREAGVIL